MLHTSSDWVAMCLVLLTYTSMALGETKTCETHFNSRDMDTLEHPNQRHVHQYGKFEPWNDVCRTECHDCVDLTLCGTIISDLNLVDPHANYSESVSSFRMTLESTCSDILQAGHSMQAVECSLQLSTCTNFCPICRDLELCTTLTLPIHNLSLAEVPYALGVICNYTIRTCRDVHTNAIPCCFSNLPTLIMVLFMWCIIVSLFAF